MSNQNHSFQSVLKTLEANEITVAEGGFLLTEEQLNKLDASLAAAATAATDSQTKMADLQTKLDAATQNEAGLKKDLEAAQKQVADLEAASKQFFGQEANGEDDPGQEQDVNLSEHFAHNQAADEMI